MDPNANLAEQLRIARRVLAATDKPDTDPDGLSSLVLDRLAELVLALDNWIRNGGELPQDWQD